MVNILSNRIIKRLTSFFLICFSLVLLIRLVQDEFYTVNNYDPMIEPSMKISYDVKSDKIKRCFVNVLKRYENLHQYHIHLHQKQLSNSTMSAQPVIKWNNLFTGIKEYKIILGFYVMDSDILVEDIPNQVLEGWFAHELGHISDYEQYTNFEMLLYGIKYLLSSSFKKKVEHEADYIALKKGFRKEIIATKKYILTEGLFSDRYTSIIKKYYLPIEALESVEKEPEDTLSGIYHE